MALTPVQRKRVTEFAAEANKFLGGAVRPDGAPLTFAQLEAECIEAGNLFTRLTLQARVAERQAEQISAHCPTCQQLGQPQEDEPRVLQTDRGEVVWTEPAYYCSACRRAFFPSHGGIGTDL